MSALLEERERARLAALTNCDEDAIERIIAAAAAECLVVVLPSFHTVGDFAGWDAFAWDGQAKAAHLAEVGAHRALCGAPRPYKSASPGPRMRLCIGCESHVRRLANRPGALAGYARGKEPVPLSDAPLPALRRPQPDAAAEARPPRTAHVRQPHGSHHRRHQGLRRSRRRTRHRSSMAPAMPLGR